MTEATGINPKDIMGAKKPDFSLIPGSAMIAMASALQNGADKYGPYNWRENGKAVQTRTYGAAALRHIASWLDGEEVASDSGCLHLGHAMATLAIIHDAMVCGNAVDNRPSKGVTGKMLDECLGPKPFKLDKGPDLVVNIKDFPGVTESGRTPLPREGGNTMLFGNPHRTGTTLTWEDSLASALTICEFNSSEVVPKLREDREKLGEDLMAQAVDDVGEYLVGPKEEHDALEPY